MPLMQPPGKGTEDNAENTVTSEERREARYQRRKAARQAKKDRLRDCDDYAKVFTYEHLYAAYRKCRRTVAWKASVQRYIATAPLSVYQVYQSLRRGTYRSPGFFEFDLYERGKLRHIRSTVIGERVVQRCLCDYCLVPVIWRTLIYDNGASLTNKGYDFAVRRLEHHLQSHFRTYGMEGYILLFDFRHFFDNIDHGLMKKQLAAQITDPRLLALLAHFIDMFGPVGLGLGSQISQILALFAATELDHEIKDRMGVRYYARYNDDGYLIFPEKEQATAALGEMRTICDRLGLTLNPKKTQVVKLTHGFTWLHIRIRLQQTGKVVMKVYHRSVTRQRRKLKKLRSLLDDGKILFEDVWNAWQSWASYASKFDSWHTLQSAGALYDKLFIWEEY